MYTFYTEMSVTRYKELLEGMLNGTLLEKWNQKNPEHLTKEDKTEERQIKAIALICSVNKNNVALNSFYWKRLVLLRDKDKLNQSDEFKLQLFT